MRLANARDGVVDWAETSKPSCAGQFAPHLTASIEPLSTTLRADGLRPDLSAKFGLTSRQKAALSGAGIFGVASAWLAPQMATAGLQGLCALSFAMLLALRLIAIGEALRPETARFIAAAPDSEPAELPVYSVLVALYDEAPVVAQLLRALERIDYPRDKLEIIFALEADDGATRTALAMAGLGDHMRCVVVPEGAPRTKPRALDYALRFVRGDYVVVFDAEDEPEPGQLREAVAAFETCGNSFGCMQARLNIYNRRENWLTSGIMAQRPQDI